MDLNGGVSGASYWLFENAAEEKENIEKAIVYTLRQRQINNKVKMKDYKGAIILIGKKNRCLSIYGDKSFEIIVSCMTVGSYLYVGFFRNEKKGLFGAFSRKMNDNDIFRQQQCDAICAAIVDCCEDAFQAVGIWENRKLRVCEN